MHSTVTLVDSQVQASATPRVLIVDDDIPLARELVVALHEYEIEASHAGAWENALQAVSQAPPDLVVLDQRLGKVDTITRLPQLRQLTSAPIVMLTANSAADDRIVALEMGADDFLVKPVSGRELVARVRAHLRRVQQAADAQEVEGSWLVSQDKRCVYRPNGEPVPLTATEFEFFFLLHAAKGQPVDREELSNKVLRRPYRQDDRSLDSLVYQVRKKFGLRENGDIVVAVRNRGYAFVGFPGQ